MFGCMISFGYYLALVVGGLLLGNAELYVAWAVSSPLYPSPVLIRFASATTYAPLWLLVCVHDTPPLYTGIGSSLARPCLS